jgi:hypothetical protein
MSKCGFNAAMQNGGKKRRTNKHRGGFWPFSDNQASRPLQPQVSQPSQPQIPQLPQLPPINESTEGFFSKMLKKVGFSSQSGGRRYKSRKNKRKSYKPKRRLRSRTRKN